MKCGECLWQRIEVVELVEGVCPKCGTDYRPPDKEPQPDPLANKELPR